MTPELKTNLTTWTHGQSKQQLMAYHTLGILILPHLATVTLVEVAQELNRTIIFVQQAVQCALKFSAKEMRFYTRLRTNADKPFTWSHVRALFKVEAQKERRRWALRAIAESWTAAMLVEQIAAAGNKIVRTTPGRNPRGRSVSRPATVLEATIQQNKALTDICRRSRDVWSNPKYDLLALLNITPEPPGNAVLGIHTVLENIDAAVVELTKMKECAKHSLEMIGRNTTKEKK
jgi:hypothetical protein